MNPKSQHSHIYRRQMSCAPIDENPPTHVHECIGFLFAFYNYSQVPKTTWIEKFVHVVTGSDSIHVAILPVPKCLLKFEQGSSKTNIQVHRLHVEDVTYTAFMGSGFEINKASSVLNAKYEYIFLPVNENCQYQSGITFLKSLGGSGYNYLGLPLTVLPKVLKPPVRDTEFYSACAPSKVFCSQMGLMLLYRCGLLPHTGIDPSSCNPGDLHRILKSRAGGVSCHRGSIEVSRFPPLNSEPDVYRQTIPNVECFRFTPNNEPDMYRQIIREAPDIREYSVPQSVFIQNNNNNNNNNN
jgi:hypothetical protein